MHLGRPAKAFVLFSAIAIASTLALYRLAATSTAGSVAFVVSDVSPSATASPSFPLNAPNHVAIADLNGDGCPDLVVPNLHNDTIAIFLNQKVGGVCTSQYVQTGIQLTGGAEPEQVALAKFQNSQTCLSNNGDVGIAVVEQGSGKVEIFQGNGNGTFAAPVTVNVCGLQTSTTCRPSSIAVGDLNNDGIPDIAVGYAANQSGAVGFLTGSLNPVTCAYSLSSPTFKDTSPASGTVLGIVMASLQAPPTPSNCANGGKGICDVAATDFAQRNGRRFSERDDHDVAVGDHGCGSPV